MKISELTDKTFLSAPGAVANSYVLINYEDSTTSEPVTYKATVQELGKAIANNLSLCKDGTHGHLQKFGVAQGAYENADVEKIVYYGNSGELKYYESDESHTVSVTGPGDYYISYDNGYKLVDANDESTDPVPLPNAVADLGYNDFDDTLGYFAFYVPGNTVTLYYPDVVDSSRLKPVEGIAYLGTSDNMPAIYDASGVFQGFLSNSTT